MPFTLIRLDKHGDVVTEHPTDYGPYETGAVAAKEAFRLSALDGQRYQPRKMKEVYDWRAALTREMEALPSDSKLPSAWDIAIPADHFAVRHLGQYVIYTQDEADGERDRRTTLRVGRYLKQFFPELSEAHRSRLIAQFDPSGSVHFATEPSDVRRVYRDGPDSCMRGDKGQWEDEDGKIVFPVEVYGGPDLAVAYLKDTADNITARAVCWPAQKQHGRLYGDVDRLGDALSELGYASVDNFDGATVTPVEVKYDEKNCYALPYLDNIDGFHFLDDGETIVTDLCADGGEMQKAKYAFCYFDEVSNINIYLKRRRCPVSKGYYDESDMVTVDGFDEPVSHYGIAMLKTCHVTGRKMLQSDMVHIRMVYPERWYSKAIADEHTAVCLFGGNRYPLTHMFKVEGGYVANRHTAEWQRRQERLKPNSEASS